jgi:formiminoglutamase
MDISIFFTPLDKLRFGNYEDQKSSIGNVVTRFLEVGSFPSFEGVNIAIFGVEEDRGSVRNDGCAQAPDMIREKLYALKVADYPYSIVDLGNLIVGESLSDTYAAVTSIMVELLKEGVLTGPFRRKSGSYFCTICSLSEIRRNSKHCFCGCII